MRKLGLICLMAVMTATSVLPVAGATSKLKEAQNKKSSIEEQLNSIDKKKKQEQNKIQAAAEEKADLESAQQKEKEEEQQLKKELEQMNADIKVIEDSIAQAENSYQKQRELFKTRVRIMYENSQRSYIQTLAQSKNITDFMSRLQYISKISKKDKELMESIALAKKEVEYKKQLKEQAAASKADEVAVKTTKIKQLQVSRANLEEQIKNSKAKLAQYEKQEDELEKASNELEKLIVKLQSTGAYTGGVMKWPVPSSQKISSPYGWRIHPIFKSRKFHTGIDISAKSGQAITAANKGKVIFAGWKSGYGYTIIIDHGGGISTLYAHSSKLIASVGDSVNAGDVVAKIGSTGYSTGPHLHFEVRVKGAHKDPMPYLRGK